MVEDWLANAYGGMSRREFLATVGATGIGLAGFHIAATPVAGKVITTLLDGIAVTEGTVPSGDFRIPIYEARPILRGNIRLFWSSRKYLECMSISRMSHDVLLRKAF